MCIHVACPSISSLKETEGDQLVCSASSIGFAQQADIDKGVGLVWLFLLGGGRPKEER